MPAELSAHLAEALDVLGYSRSEGLFTIERPSEPGSRDYYWQELRDKVGLDAVFFNDGVPIVGFSSAGDPTGLAGVRKRLWNYGRVPLLINVSEDEISAFSAATSVPSISGIADSGQIYGERREWIASQLLRVLQRSEIESGRFDFDLGQISERTGRVDRVLLRNLSLLKQESAATNPQQGDAFETLIGGCLVASYLRDRGILNAEHMNSLAGMAHLDEVLTEGLQSARRLFEGLAERFNGDVFGAVPDALTTIRGRDLNGIAAMLRGDDLASGQEALWPYDFSVLPADLVSSVYEELLADTRQKDSAYYTPRFLVDLVLDEILPWNVDLKKFVPPTIADIACGSGAFMIEAFRRITYLTQAKTGRKPTYAELNDLLSSNIHGVDQNPAAARVAAFGLYLSVLEKVDPPDIWDEVRLPQLIDRNVIVADAFDDHHLRNRTFDVVVSNPPWSSRLTKLAGEYVRRSGVPVSDQQLSQAFVWLARDMLGTGGRLGLVLPSKPLLHNRSTTAHEFRRSLFGELDVAVVVDLSAVRRTVFAAAIAPAAVLIASRRNEDDEDPHHSGEILHVAAHPRSPETPLDALVISPEEIHSVTRDQAIARPDIWKVLLWGSRRDLELLDRLRRNYRSVGEIGRQKGWTTGQGFQIGGGDSNDATDLIGLPIVDTKSIRFLYVRQDRFTSFDRQTLHRPRARDLFSAPLVLIRRGIFDEGIAATYLDDDAVFPNGIIGVAGSQEDSALLAALAITTVSSLGKYWHFMTSASWGVERDFVELNEHLSLPLAEPDIQTATRIFELLDRAKREDSAELRAEVDAVVFDLYGLTDLDRARVVEKMHTAIGRFYRHANSQPEDVETSGRYERRLFEVLQATLPRLSVTTRVFNDGPYRAVAVTFGSDQGSEQQVSLQPVHVDIDVLLSQMSKATDKPTAVMAQPSGFFFDEDTVFLVKTNETSRWSDDSALDDAEKILAALTGGI